MDEFKLENTPDQTGKVAIVTGANTGLGYETSLGLVSKNCNVIMACRNKDKANRSREKIIEQYPRAEIEVIKLDLSKLSSVKSFAHEFKNKYKVLNYLINNAGILIPPYSRTEDGFESQMATNYFGHFALTGLLLPLLGGSIESRIITLSSLAHHKGDINFKDLHFEKNYKPFEAYACSKLACLMFAYELDIKLKERNCKTLSIASHPGISSTNIVNAKSPFLSNVFKLIGPIIFQDAKKGAEPILRAILDPNSKGGEYYGPSGWRQYKGKAVKVKSNSWSHNREVSSKLFEVSEELTAVTYFNKNA